MHSQLQNPVMKQKSTGPPSQLVSPPEAMSPSATKKSQPVQRKTRARTPPEFLTAQVTERGRVTQEKNAGKRNEGRFSREGCEHAREQNNILPSHEERVQQEESIKDVVRERMQKGSCSPRGEELLFQIKFWA